MSVFDNRRIVEVESNGLSVGYIDTSRPNRPEWLKKPYEYVLPMESEQRLWNDLKAFFKRLEAATIEEKQFQCMFPERKRRAYGSHIHAFLLASNQLIARGEEQVWIDACEELQRIFRDALGPDANIYADPFNREKKPQARFDAIIAFEEMRQQATLKWFLD